MANPVKLLKILRWFREVEAEQRAYLDTLRRLSEVYLELGAKDAGELLSKPQCRLLKKALPSLVEIQTKNSPKPTLIYTLLRAVYEFRAELSLDEISLQNLENRAAELATAKDRERRYRFPPSQRQNATIKNMFPGMFRREVSEVLVYQKKALLFLQGHQEKLPTLRYHLELMCGYLEAIIYELETTQELQPRYYVAPQNLREIEVPLEDDTLQKDLPISETTAFIILLLRAKMECDFDHVDLSKMVHTVTRTIQQVRNQNLLDTETYDREYLAAIRDLPRQNLTIYRGYNTAQK